MAKLRHLGIATEDPDRTAQFYIDVLEFKKVRVAEGVWGHGHILSDGTINLAILKFVTDEAAGVEGYRFPRSAPHRFRSRRRRRHRATSRGRGRQRGTDIDDALGIPHDGPIKGEFKYEGPDGVVFDLSQPGVWQLS